MFLSVSRWMAMVVARIGYGNANHRARRRTTTSLFDSSEPSLSTTMRTAERWATLLGRDGLFAVVTFERRLVSLVVLVFVHALDPSLHELEGSARERSTVEPRDPAVASAKRRASARRRRRRSVRSKPSAAIPIVRPRSAASLWMGVAAYPDARPATALYVPSSRAPLLPTSSM